MTPHQLRDIRHTMQLTQTQMGERIGRSLRSVMRWESGEVPVPEPVAKLLALLQTK